MRLRVQLFAVAKEFAKQSAIELDVPEPASVADVRRALFDRVPQLADFGAQLRLAINGEYAGDKSIVPPAAEIACIPPVSGG